MGKIETEIQFENIYERGKNVHLGNLEKRKAIDELVADCGLNESSANYFISAVIAALSNDLNSSYRTSTNINFTKYFLTRIQKEYASIKFRSAIECVYKHVEYWIFSNRNQNVKMTNFIEMLEEFTPDLFIRDDDENLPKAAVANSRALQLKFQENINQAKRLSPIERALRSSNYPTKPKRVLTTVWAFQRNECVVVDVLIRAKGQCEVCESAAPFVKKRSGEPYLEIHHKIPLAEDGDDTVENAIALCPNCHREAHHGVNWDKYRK